MPKENSKDDQYLSKNKGGVIVDGEFYFDPQQMPRKRSQSLSANTKLQYEDTKYYDPISEDLSTITRSNSISSTVSTTDESLLTDISSKSSSPDIDTASASTPTSVKQLKALFEPTHRPDLSQPSSPTKAIKGIYAGKEIHAIREAIREAVDPHTYQETDKGKIEKVPYGHQNRSKSRL